MTIECAFLGTLGRDAGRRVSKSGKNYLRLNVRTGGDEVGQWVGVMCFDQTAIRVADKLVNAAKVYVEGKLSLDEWTGQDGQKRTGLSVMSWHCRLAHIGRQKLNRDGEKGNSQVSVAAVSTYHSPRSAPAGRLPSSDFNDDAPFAPEVR